MSGQDEQIRRVLSDERKIDERLAPSFDATLTAPRRRSMPVMWRLIPVAGLVVFVAAITLVVFRPWPSRPPQADTRLLYWESPTEACLSSPGEGVLRYVVAEDSGRNRRGRQ
jgi:hypothetical protein